MVVDCVGRNFLRSIFAMASIPIRLRRKTLNPNLSSFRFFSTSSTTPSEPPPTRNPEPEDAATANDRPPSIFSDIKAHLRKSPPGLRHPPDLPEDIRGKLDEFRSRSAPPSSPTSPLSFNELYKSNAEEKSKKKHEPISFNAIRNSLRQIRQQNQNQNQNQTRDFFPSDLNRPTERLRNLKERLNVMQLDARGSQSSSLPRSIFGREMDENTEMESGDRADKTKRTDFVKMYSHEELGEKLRFLRPNESGEKDKAKGSGFSLEELNDRLAKLREMEEREKNTSKIGVSFRDLRESLEKLRDSETQKKSSMQRFSILAHIGGFGTPEYSLGPPKEELVQRYLHPDLMSSEEKMKLELKKIRDEFKISESDCGSSRVQVAQLTVKIKHLSSVLHKKDKHSLRGLQAMVQRRRKLLKYLRRTDWDSYCFVISKLKLRDTPDIKSSRPSSSNKKKKPRKIHSKRKKITNPKPSPTPTPTPA